MGRYREAPTRKKLHLVPFTLPKLPGETCSLGRGEEEQTGATLRSVRTQCFPPLPASHYLVHHSVLNMWCDLRAPATRCTLHRRSFTDCCRFKDQMWQKVATEMGIPWRSAESMHWQLGEQEMSARANAPVFQLHPSATSTGLNSPPTASVPVSMPGQPPPPPVMQNQIPPSHGFTAANTPQPIQYAQPPPQQQQQYQQPPPLPQATWHPSHRRSDSNTSQGFSRRRARNSVPPQLGPTMPPFHPQSEADLVSGARTAPAPDTTSREDAGPLGDPFGKRKRDDEAVQGLRGDGDVRSQGARSPDRVSLRSGTGSVKSVKRSVGDVEEAEQARFGPPATTA